MSFTTAFTALASVAAAVGLVAFCAAALVLAVADVTGRDLAGPDRTPVRLAPARLVPAPGDGARP